MKNSLLCLLSIVFLFSVSITAQAGFLVKKQIIVSSASTTASGTSHVHTGWGTRVTEKLQQIMHPSFQRFAYRGWIGIFAFICGIAGFFYGGFAVAAALFGLLGMGRRHRNSGLAIAGFVLGMAAILLSIFLKFSGFPLF